MNLKVLFFIVCLWCSFIGELYEVKAQAKSADENVIAEGLLPVYKFNDKIYILIAEELLGHEFMITAQVDKGRGKYGELLESKGVFVLKSGKDKELNVYGVAATEQVTNKELLDGCKLELSGLKNYEEIWTADRRMGSGYLVEITAWLKEPGEWYRLDNSLRMSNFADPDILDVSACKDGVCFKVRHCVNVSPKQGIVEMAAENGKSYVDVSVALKLLPDDCRKTVIMFPDSPFRTQKAMDYGINPWGCVKCSRGVHWNISKETPLRISVDNSMPAVYLKALQIAIGNVSKKMGMADGIILERKNQPLDAMESCGVVFVGENNELNVDCMEHPATGHLLVGRMLVGEKNIDARILRWQLNNMVKDDDESWRICSQKYAYEKCLEENMEKGLLILLGIDEAKLENGIKDDDIWNSLRYVYADDQEWLRKERVCSTGGNLWGMFVQSRNNRKKLLEQLDVESVLAYYKQCLVMNEEEYISVFKRGEWKDGDVRCFLELMVEDAWGGYATDYIRRSMLGRNAKETSESLVRIWNEFFNLDRWLEWAQRPDCHEVFGVLERELSGWLYEGKRRKVLTSAQMMVRDAFSDALSKQLKSCHESINYGSGVAANRVLSCWEFLYEQRKREKG